MCAFSFSLSYFHYPFWSQFIVSGLSHTWLNCAYVRQVQKEETNRGLNINLWIHKCWMNVWIGLTSLCSGYPTLANYNTMDGIIYGLHCHYKVLNAYMLHTRSSSAIVYIADVQFFIRAFILSKIKYAIECI